MKNIKTQIQSIVDLYKAGDFINAESLCKKLLIDNPSVVFLYNLLGLIFVAVGKVDKAIESYERGIRIDPNFAMIYNNIGLTYAESKKDYIKAESNYKKSISLDNNKPEPHNNLGSLYKTVDKPNDAIMSFKRAIDIDKNFVHAYHNIGNVYTSMGKFEEAKEYYRKSIKINPLYTDSHRTLSRILKYKENEKHLQDLKRIYPKIKSENIKDKVNISFALGKAYEDIKNYEKSFLHYKNANFNYDKKINYSIEKEYDKFDRIKKTFNKKIYQKFNGVGSSSTSSIFILGMPRSGTTLVEQILSSHPKIFGADEQTFISSIINKEFGNHDLRLFFEAVINFDKKRFNDMGEYYTKLMKNISNNAEFTTDKMPENFLCIGFIKLILPNSKIIHCSRNSKDICLSIYKNHFPGGKIPYSYNLDNIVQYYNLYDDIMTYWNNLFPNTIFNIKYEKLIQDSRKEIINLLNFCKLEWNDDCINFHENKRVIKTASDVQARSKIYNSSVNAWKNYDKYLEKYFSKLIN